ncbi:Protein-tyrosine phosphatase [Oesophagostomum dentatum]|uniref:Protein-tyrosine phosphatase n=1 Tax=Oesophagostomum dentatum TaxID=61180 RepID=A0A0B1TD27_OESDE|nr:Protein-tyrosine phosphatase [Oesophagostomum dentatum]
MSASSTKGEGQRSVEHVATTDVAVPPPPEINLLTFDCKNGIMLQWTNSASYICHVEVKNDTNVLLFNTTASKIDVIDLSLQDEYRTKVRCSARSTVDNRTLITGPWGQEQRFVLNQQCNYQSSVCSPNSKCMRLRDNNGTPRISILVAIAALFLFVVLCFLIIYSLKGRCLDIKMLIKKKEKCVYLEELSPLVYDSATCDDIPVELFYGYCEDLARNSNAKYKQQFEQIEMMTSCDCSEPDALEKNLDKNRYLNIGAIEASRVRINSTTNGSDYINANYIDSCEKRNAYIATQAPLPSTFADFWEMIWQERSNIIVVITNMVEDGRGSAFSENATSTGRAPAVHLKITAPTKYLNYLGEENVNGKTRMQMQYEDICECLHNPICTPPTEYITLPGYHRPDEFIVANWPKECSELWQLIWNQNCQTVVLLGEGDYWTGIEQVNDLSIQHGDNFVLLQNNEDQLCVRIVVVTRAALESDLWAEIERVQMERLAYHDAPLLIINPIRPDTRLAVELWYNRDAVFPSTQRKSKLRYYYETELEVLAAYRNM